MVYRWRHSGKGYQLLVDLIVAVLLWAPLEFAWRRYLLHQNDIDLKFHFHEAGDVIVLLAYLGASLGKSVARTQAMSLTSKRMGAWQSVERALDYSAAVLEGWLGFVNSSGIKTEGVRRIVWLKPALLMSAVIAF
jgi:hypothetical protein